VLAFIYHVCELTFAITSSDGGRYRFDVRADMRGVGLIVHYEGWMVEHAG
jgi:hypothetical protein